MLQCSRKAEEESDEENSVEKTETEAEDSEKTDQGRRSSGSSVANEEKFEKTNGGPEEKVGEMKNIAGSIVRSSSSSSDSSIIEV